jgi:hypothetical protein
MQEGEVVRFSAGGTNHGACNASFQGRADSTLSLRADLSGDAFCSLANNCRGWVPLTETGEYQDPV